MATIARWILASALLLGVPQPGVGDAAEGRSPRLTEQPVSVVVPRHEPVTLGCKADGRPAPSVSWTKDGQPVEPGITHRIPLTGGNLFFLRVEAADAGVYRCVATNSAGQAVSKEATLELAFLNHVPRPEPSVEVVTVGSTVVLRCDLPKGRPEPSAVWRRDGRRLELQDPRLRMRLVDAASLAIQEVRPGDAGRYQCSAQNVAGSRNMSEILLQVVAPPQVVLEPRDAVVLLESSVVLRCNVSGEPPPVVQWRRATNGSTSSSSSSVIKHSGRVSRREDGSLHIAEARLSDSGQYVCHAQNRVGAVNATATLTVVSQPTLSPPPPPLLRLEPGDTATLSCGGRGDPPPLVMWALRGNRTVLLPGQRLDRIAVTSEPTGSVTLTLERVSRADSGRVLVCAAVNGAGAAVGRTRLSVLAADAWPPPVLAEGPANQTLPLHSDASLACLVDPRTKHGARQPTLTWYKDGAQLQLGDPSGRLHITDRGTLKIRGLQASDAGEYACVATSLSGRYAWRGWLRVGEADEPPLRASDPATFPGPPSGLRVNGSERGATLTWQRNGKVGSSTLKGYQLEVLAREGEAGGWTTVARLPLPPSTTYTYTALSAATSYLFLVRAQNSHGLSPPSDLAGPLVRDREGRWVETAGGGGDAGDGGDDALDDDVDSVPDDAPAVRLSKVVASSATSVQVLWDVVSPEQVDGMSIYWRAGAAGALQTLRVLPSGAAAGAGGAAGFVVTGLRCFTVYEFFLVPFSRDTVGVPSNSVEVRTQPAAPSAPPTRLEATLTNGSTALVKWSPPPENFQNGPLRSYQVVVQAGEPPALVSNVTLSAESALQLLLSNLSQHSAYHVSVAAATAAGLGPFSAPLAVRPAAPLHHRHGAAGGELLTETWFMALLGSMVAVMVLLFSAILFLHRRQHRANKETFLGFYDCNGGPVLTTPLALKAAEGMPHPLSAPLSPPLCLVPQDAYGAKYRGVSPCGLSPRGVSPRGVSPGHRPHAVDDLMLPEYAEANDAQYDGTSQGSTSSKSYYAEVRNPHLLSTFQSTSQLGSHGSRGTQRGSHHTDSSGAASAAPYATTTLVCSARTASTAPCTSSSTSWSPDNERVYPRASYSDLSPRSPAQCSGHYDNYNLGSHPGSPLPLDHRDAVLSLQPRCPSSSPGGTGTAGRENRRLKLLRRQLNRPVHGKGLPPSGPQSSQLQLLLRSSPASSQGSGGSSGGSGGSGQGSSSSPLGSPTMGLDLQDEDAEVLQALHHTPAPRSVSRGGGGGGGGGGARHVRQEACDYSRKYGSSGSSGGSSSSSSSRSRPSKAAVVSYSGLRGHQL